MADAEVLMSGATFGYFLAIALFVLDRIGSPILWAAFWAMETVLLAARVR